MSSSEAELKPFSFQIERSDRSVSVRVGGALTENADLAGLRAAVRGSSSLTIDLEGVSRINSCGVREWIRFINDLGSSQLAYERCSVVVVAQMNAISTFRGNGQVRSVQAPYFCSGCDQEQTLLVELSETGPLKPVPATLPCPTCQDPMEFDEILDDYLSFTQKQPA